jgi:hypothetical protein
MARCDQGYLCRICGEEVEFITDSELYLRFVIGEIDPEKLHLTQECHLRCSPLVAQFIQDERFGPPISVSGPFGLDSLDVRFVTARSQLINRGYERLWQIRIRRAENPSVQGYPLPEIRDRWT